MAVGNTQFPIMNPVQGIQLGTTNAGIKQTQRDDILIIKIPEGAQCAAVFTQNAFCAAPVVVARKHLLKQPQYLPFRQKG